MIIRKIPSIDTLKLRNEVLRPGRPVSECVFEGDDDPQTHHFGAINSENNIVGIVSLYRKDNPKVVSVNSYQLRGMATKPDCRGLGIGSMLLECAESYVKSCGFNAIWANARIAAIGFYTHHGYRVVSDEFFIDGIGPHHVVVKSFAALE